MIYGYLDLLFQLKLLKRKATPKAKQAKLNLWSQQELSGKEWTQSNY